jgi:hypothetical protein
LPAFEKQIRGYSLHDAVLTGIETRTSSPLRITRNESMQSLNVKGCSRPVKAPAMRAGFCRRVSTAFASPKPWRGIFSACKPENNTLWELAPTAVLGYLKASDIGAQNAGRQGSPRSTVAATAAINVPAHTPAPPATPDRNRCRGIALAAITQNRHDRPRLPRHLHLLRRHQRADQVGPLDPPTCRPKRSAR